MKNKINHEEIIDFIDDFLEIFKNRNIESINQFAIDNKDHEVMMQINMMCTEITCILNSLYTAQRENSFGHDN